MSDLWPTLVAFLLRLIFGIAVTMGVTPPRLVTAGFYRVHLWVLLGLSTVAALAVYTSRIPPEHWASVLGLCLAAMATSYVGSVVWLYEKQTAGLVAIFLVALLALVAGDLATTGKSSATPLSTSLAFFNFVTSGLVLGSTLCAMFLGHWYLNTPTMELAPLRRLVMLMAAAIVARSLLCAVGLGLHVSQSQGENLSWWLFVGLRWSAGLAGTLLLAGLTWQTLKIPNTQSATGILYAAVILAFIGELTAELLSAHALYPL